MSEPFRSEDLLLHRSTSNRWTATDIGGLASTLRALAEALTADSEQEGANSVFQWSDRMSNEGKMSEDLVKRAEIIYNFRRRRTKHLPSDILGEPSWDMLLDLFLQEARMKSISTTSLCIASARPPTTALRYLAVLEKKGLVQRFAAPGDKRVTLVRLTESGALAVKRCLSEQPFFSTFDLSPFPT